MAEGTIWRERPWSAEGHLGAGTPVGAVGVTLDYSFIPEVAMGGGFGMGSGLAGPALHTAAIARLRPTYGDRDAFVTSLAFSSGGYQEFELLEFNFGGEDKDYGMDWAHWFQVDLGWERRAQSGFVFRLSAGMAQMLNPDDMRCVVVSGNDAGASCGIDTHDVRTRLFTLDIAAGGSF